MNSLINQIKKTRITPLELYIGEILHGEYCIKNKGIKYYYNGNGLFLFHLDKDTVWVNLKISSRLCQFNIVGMSPIYFFKMLLCKKFNLDIRYIYSVG